MSINFYVVKTYFSADGIQHELIFDQTYPTLEEAIKSAKKPSGNAGIVTTKREIFVGEIYLTPIKTIRFERVYETKSQLVTKIIDELR